MSFENRKEDARKKKQESRKEKIFYFSAAFAFCIFLPAKYTIKPDSTVANPYKDSTGLSLKIKYITHPVEAKKIIGVTG